MSEFKVVITKDDSKINELISQGWLIVSVTAQHVATGSSANIEGKFCFVLKR